MGIGSLSQQVVMIYISAFIFFSIVTLAPKEIIMKVIHDNLKVDTDNDVIL